MQICDWQANWKTNTVFITQFLPLGIEIILGFTSVWAHGVGLGIRNIWLHPSFITFPGQSGAGKVWEVHV